MKDILKSICWGALLLVMVCIALFSAMYTVFPPSNIYITDQRQAANAKLASEVMPPLQYLAEVYSRTPDDKEYLFNSSPEAKNANHFIDAKIKACNQSKECTYVINTGIYDYLTASKLRSELNHISDPELVSNTNTSVIFASATSAIVFALSVYSIYALARFKRLGAKGLFIFFALVAPVLGLAISLACANTYLNLERRYDLNGTAITFALFFLISPFLFFPPAIITARKSGIKIIEVLKLKWRS